MGKHTKKKYLEETRRDRVSKVNSRFCYRLLTVEKCLDEKLQIKQSEDLQLSEKT